VAQLQNLSLTRHRLLVRSLAPALIGTMVPNSIVLMATGSAGFSHMSGDLIAQCAPLAIQPLRLDPIDLYRRSA
jgi:hypothetical protein